MIGKDGWETPERAEFLRPVTKPNHTATPVDILKHCKNYISHVSELTNAKENDYSDYDLLEQVEDAIPQVKALVGACIKVLAIIEGMDWSRGNDRMQETLESALKQAGASK